MQGKTREEKDYRDKYQKELKSNISSNNEGGCLIKKIPLSNPKPMEGPFYFYHPFLLIFLKIRRNFLINHPVFAAINVMFPRKDERYTQKMKSNLHILSLKVDAHIEYYKYTGCPVCAIIF